MRPVVVDMILPREDRLVMLHRRLRAVLALGLLTVGCATTSPLVRQECYNPDAQLAAVWPSYDALRAKGCVVAQTDSTTECDRLRREVQRLSVVCPGHAPTLMANALIAYDDQQPTIAQQYLDTMLSRPGSQPEAAVLRARLAIEEGNVRFAERLLQQQIKLAPDHAGLHETYAGSLYLDRRLTEAQSELTLAQALGAPEWRVAYHLGLIEEASGRREQAAQYYARALEGNPGWALAASRLRAIRAQVPTPRP